MTEAEFKEYITKELWRTNDATFTELLPSYMTKAQAAITRDVNIPSDGGNRQEVLIDVNGYGTLPPKRQTIKAVHTGDTFRGLLSFYEPHTMASSRMPLDGYSIIDGKLYIGGPPLIMNNPESVIVIYNGPLEPWFDYVSGDQRGFYFRHPDLYEAKIRTIVGASYRDQYMEERAASEYAALLDSVRTFELNQYYGDGTLNFALPGVVA